MIIGIDEVGRGCWAGPLVAAAVGFDDNLKIPGLNDSKKLSAKKRLALISDIKNATTHIGIGWVWPSEINSLGLTASVELAMYRAINQFDPNMHQETEIIIDGNINYLKKILDNNTAISRVRPWKWEKYVLNSKTVIGGDGRIQAISAASIIAKVGRDTYMQKIAEKYPDYGFEKHVGYGTKVHIEALSAHGVLPIHRINYAPIKRLLMTNI